MSTTYNASSVDLYRVRMVPGGPFIAGPITIDKKDACPNKHLNVDFTGPPQALNFIPECYDELYTIEIIGATVICDRSTCARLQNIIDCLEFFPIEVRAPKWWINKMIRLTGMDITQHVQAVSSAPWEWDFDQMDPADYKLCEYCETVDVTMRRDSNGDPLWSQVAFRSSADIDRIAFICPKNSPFVFLTENFVNFIRSCGIEIEVKRAGILRQA